MRKLESQQRTADLFKSEGDQVQHGGELAEDNGFGRGVCLQHLVHLLPQKAALFAAQYLCRRLQPEQTDEAQLQLDHVSHSGSMMTSLIPITLPRDDRSRHERQAAGTGLFLTGWLMLAICIKMLKYNSAHGSCSTFNPFYLYQSSSLLVLLCTVFANKN